VLQLSKSTAEPRRSPASEPIMDSRRLCSARSRADLQIFLVPSSLTQDTLKYGALYLCLRLNGRMHSISSCLQLEHGAPCATMLHRTFRALHVVQALELLFFPLLFEIGRGTACVMAEALGVGLIAMGESAPIDNSGERSYSSSPIIVAILIISSVSSRLSVFQWYNS
jgi:hypothetical protein